MNEDTLPTIEDVARKGRRVFLRCDFNVPLGAEKNILDDFRIRAALPTIQALQDKETRIVVGTHLGGPKGTHEPTMSARVIAKRLEELISRPVFFCPHSVGSDAQAASLALKNGDIMMLENLRSRAEEEANDESFARELSLLADCYVNEAFSVAHRRHASVIGIPKFLPSALGPLFLREIRTLSALLKNPARPFVAVIGGTKIQSKLGVVDRLLEYADVVLLGSVLSKEAAQMGIAGARAGKLVLSLDGFPSDEHALDIGARTRKRFCEVLGTAKTVVWAGPLGMIEDAAYAKGSLEVAECIASAEAYSVIGGGSLGAFVESKGLSHLFSHISTGGGALLEYISAGDLPGLRAVREGHQ